MKKTIKRIIITALIISLLVISVIAASADTTYVLDGYTYSVKDNTSISLRNWDTSVSTTLSVPDMLANRYFTEVANWALENRSDITGLDLSNAGHLKRIGYESFIGCSGIATPLVLPQSVESLSERSFSGCSSIPSVTINGNVIVIPTECFYDCDSITTVVLPDNLQTIQSWAFGDCAALEYVEIPRSVNSISVSAFLNDPNLTLGVWFNSYAHTYAKSNNISYRLLDEFRLGDVNLDGNVNINDVTAIQRHLASIEQLNDLQILAADVDRNGNLVINDATTIQLYIAGYTLPYPINQITTA